MPDETGSNTVTTERPTPEPPSPEPTTGPTLTGRIIDAVLDVTVLSFAFWTLLYCLGLATQWSLWPSGWIWGAVTLVLLGWRLRSALTHRTGEAPSEVADDAGLRRRDVLLVPGIGLVAVATAGGLLWTPSTFTETWFALVVGIAVLLVWSWLSGRVRPAEPEEAAPVGKRRLISLSEIGVLVISAGTGVLTAFVHLADTDDPYYINRSVWVAEHGNAALRDTMFSPETLESAYEAGLPIASIESLYGVIAHATGLHAGTVNYLLAAPLAAVLAVLATWRLARTWAPRRPFWVFLAAIAFLMLSGNSMLGNYWIPRIWQGKVIALVVLMPLIWAYLVDVHDARTRRDRWTAVGLLFAAGIAFFGLTPTAVVWAPVMALAAVVSAVALRSWFLAIGGAAMAIGPIASGAAVKLYAIYSDDAVGGAQGLLTPRASWVRVLGEQKPMVALGILGVGLAVLLARRGAPAALAGSAAFGSVLIYTPGIPAFIDDATGTASILWRMLMVTPVPVVVGLLAAAPVPPLAKLKDSLRPVARAVPIAAAVLLLAGLAFGGRPVTHYTGHGGPVTLMKKPNWKVDLEALDDVRALMRDDDVRGTVLLPPRRMRVMTMYTTEAFPVVARQWWIDFLQEPKPANKGRRVLYRLASGDQPLPQRKDAEKAFEALDVTLACVDDEGDDPQRVLKIYEKSGYSERATYGTLTCARRPT